MITGDRPAPRVLVVDDDELIRSVLHTALVQSGYSVRDAETGADALRLLAIHPVDLLILDAHMDGETLEQNLVRFRALSETPRIVVLSGAKVAQPLLDRFDASYLAKPVDFAQFLAHVATALGRDE